MTIDIPMPRGNPVDEKYRELRRALDDARRTVTEAQRQGVDSQDLLGLRHQAYRAWQVLEQYLRDHEIIAGY